MSRGSLCLGLLHFGFGGVCEETGLLKGHYLRCGSFWMFGCSGDLYFGIEHGVES